MLISVFIKVHLNKHKNSRLLQRLSALFFYSHTLVYAKSLIKSSTPFLKLISFNTNELESYIPSYFFISAMPDSKIDSISLIRSLYDNIVLFSFSLISIFMPAHLTLQ